ncbi:MAG: hypothetical protein MUF63_05870 [Rhodobacteraceae bacterium]|nr:hypothetical protein [Paracoccaceae bacterium]
MLALFPRRVEILRIYLSDPAFRDLCEDLVEAHQSFQRLKALPGTPERMELAEYSRLISELEQDVRAYVTSKSRGRQRLSADGSE